jgi:alkanesulfonate monooxygenase SsuD/methylene tetrahydromethanopterin reductase-like flavin-dependent oxidoreductase (luciferase family)
MDIQFPYWVEMLDSASRERGWARPTINTFQAEIAGGSLYVGSPETVATKLASTIRLLGLSRFDLAYAVGRVPHEQRMATIELYGREVIPRVRDLLTAAPDDANAAYLRRQPHALLTEPAKN